MKALTSLISILLNHFSIHPARKETLGAMVCGIMNSGNVCHISLSHYLTTKPKSSLRRIERFFQKESLSFVESARSIVEVLKFKGKFELCLDRTNWKFGEKDINYLVLSWRIAKRISIPLFAIELNKAGNSNTSERIKLLEEFGKVFGFHRIKLFLADREFVGDVWFRKLIELKVPFYIRVKENGLVPYGEDAIYVGSLFKHLKSGEYRIIEKDMYGSTVYFAGTRAIKGDLVIVMSNQNVKAKTILERYRKRWSIEEMFKKLKTTGFHWENTHMTKSERLQTLLVIMSLASFLISCMASNTNKVPWKKTIKCPLWSFFKQGMINFQNVAAKSMEMALRFIFQSIQKQIKLVS